MVVLEAKTAAAAAASSVQQRWVGIERIVVTVSGGGSCREIVTAVAKTRTASVVVYGGVDAGIADGTRLRV